ncbi:MAG: glutamylcysteine synthetase [Clostridiales bacterium]|nr:glutamylcysteine synthetase [Clostridiales bacterium]
MEQEELRKHLYDKYIKPTVNNKKDFIGIEIEIPVVNIYREAVDFKKVHSFTQNFIKHFDFEVLGRNDDGNIYSSASKENGDIFSFDCSYNNLEFSFGKEKNIFNIERRFNVYYAFLQDEFKKYNYILTGMGINPYRRLNHNEPIQNGRYRMLFHHLSSYQRYYDIPMYFHKYPAFGMFSSASQVQLDVNYDNLTVTLNAFSKLEPIKALLFSNSVLLGEHDDIMCYRDILWENSTQGLNPHNIGMYNSEFSSAEDILSYIETTGIYCVERNKKYINFKPINISEYFKTPHIEGEYYENGEYKKIEFTPKISDLDYLRTYKFEDLTFRGTVEYRSCCCQPIKDSMTVAAFHLGLKNKIHELNEMMTNDEVIYHHGYTDFELRKLFIRNEIPKFVDEDNLYRLTKDVVDLAYKGLSERGYGEEAFLSPLYDRISQRTNPAKKMLAQLNNMLI